jgi:hypothetical protein
MARPLISSTVDGVAAGQKCDLEVVFSDCCAGWFIAVLARLTGASSRRICKPAATRLPPPAVATRKR